MFNIRKKLISAAFRSTLHSVLTLAGICLLPLASFAQDGKDRSIKLPEVVIEAEEEGKNAAAKPLPDKVDAKIFSGKKTTVTELKQLPNITTNNFRQAFSQTAGLLTSEVSNEGIASFSYRGLGDPHESFNLNILRDGVPISADLFGYPANYYQPPLESIKSIEFVRGGSSLLYGPQVGGALNYISRDPDTSAPLTLETKQVFGERNLYSTYNQVSGSKDGIGYLGFFHHRESDGFRTTNSDYAINNGDIKVTFDSNSRAKWTVGVDVYSADHGEAGGLSLKRGPGLANYYDDRNQSQVEFDRLRIERYAPTVKLAYDMDADTTLRATAFGGYYRRFSRRQSAGTAEAFGGIYNGTTNAIVLQEFSSVGLDTRLSHDWNLGEEKQTLAVGTLLFWSDSPFRQEEGSSPFANTGALKKRLERTTLNAALFAENQFVFGDLKITPGLRFENIYQDVDEKVNAAAPTELRDESDYVGTLLPGLSLAYNVGHRSEVYANVSTAFKPKTFQDTVPLNSGDTISNNLNSSYARTYELGVRGNPISYARFDTSVFYIRYDDQFGRVGSNIQNVGDSETIGFDVSSEVGTLSALDQAFDTDLADTVGELNLFANASFLDAKFISGPQENKTPQYAPDYLIRTGLRYDAFQKFKLACIGTLVDNHFADDGNTADRFIPSYVVWDLTAEAAVWGNQFSLVAGVNNIFDKDYYARVRSNGIDPGLPRNAYGGFIFKF